MMIWDETREEIKIVREKLKSSESRGELFYWVFVGTNLMYTLDGFGAGGYAHLVTDDWNIGLGFIDDCIEYCDKNEYGHDSDAVGLCRDVLQASKGLTEIERSYAFGFEAAYFSPDDEEYSSGEDFSNYHKRKYF